MNQKTRITQITQSKKKSHEVPGEEHLLLAAHLALREARSLFLCNPAA
jgi:hypothetical protein